MKSRKIIISLIASIVATTIVTAPSLGVTLNPKDARGIRKLVPELGGGPPFLLDFLAVKKGDDTTVVEFDVSGISGQIQMASLLVGLDNFDEGGDIGIIDLYKFVGRGTVIPDDFSAGTLFTSFPFNDDRGTVAVDVTVAVQEAVELGNQFLSFRLYTNTNDRYFLGSIVGFSPPELVVAENLSVPEPSSTWGLLTFGALGVGSVLKRKQKQQKSASSVTSDVW